MRLYFSGLAGDSERQMLVEAGVTHVRADQFDIEHTTGFPHVAIDCGAYRIFKNGGTIDVGNYIRRVYDGDYELAMAPDVIGDPTATMAYWKHVRIYDRLTPVFQWGAPMDDLKRYLDDRRIVAIGGLVPLMRAKDTDMLDDLTALCEMYPDRFHILGMNWPQAIQELKDLVYSADTSKFLDGGRYGHVIFCNTRSKKLTQAPAKVLKALESGRRDGSGGLAPATVAYHAHVLSSALSDAVKADDVSLSRNPAAGCRLGDTSSPEMAVLTADEVRRLLKAAEGTVWETVVTLAVCTGCRRGELAGLKWRDVDFERGTIRILRSLSQVGKNLKFTAPKRHARRTIKLPLIAIRALERQKDAQETRKKALGLGYQDNDLVCCQLDGTMIKPDSLSHNFHRILKKAGIRRVRLHDMRHTKATTLLEQGADLKTVQEDLGHRDGRTTMNFYAHVTPSMKQAAADSLDRAFGEAEDPGASA